jgi:ankyrin repeat protein
MELMLTHKVVRLFLVTSLPWTIDTGGEYGTALQAAAYGNNPNIMTILLKFGANVNARGEHDIYGTTQPL